MVPVPCREMWSREGKIDGGFTRRPEFAWGVLNASIGRVHTREAGPRGVSDADRSLLLSRDVHPAYGPRTRARTRASKTEDRAGPKADADVGAPRWLRPGFRGDETRSARTAAGSEARARFGRRGRARRGSDGRTSRRFPGVARSGAGNNETPDRLAMETGYLGGITPDRLHLADESSRQTGAVGGNCELANFYSNRQRPTKPNCLHVSVEDLSTWISQRPAPAAQSEMSHT